MESNGELGLAGRPAPVLVIDPARRVIALLVLSGFPCLPLAAAADAAARNVAGTDIAGTDVGGTDVAGTVRSLYEAGEYLQAAAAAQNAQQTSPDLLVYHGLALARLDRLDEAQAVFRRGRKLYPKDHRFLLELAGVAYRGKRMADAKSFLRKALKLVPQDNYANDFLGSLCLLDGNLAAALKYWNRIDKPLIQERTLTPPPDLDTVLLERAVAISGGQIFTLDRLRTTEANLDRLDIFARRRIELSPRQDQRFDVTLRLTPLGPALTGWPGHALAAARGLPYQMVHFDRHNIANRAINFKSLWRWDRNKRRIDLELAGPLRLNPRFGYRLSADARDENWLLTDAAGEAEARDLKLRKAAFGADLVFALSEKTAWTTGAGFTRRGFQSDDGSAIFADSWSFEQRNELAYRLLDLPERNLRLDSAARLRTGRVFTARPSRFGIVEGDLSGAWKPQAQGGVWETHTRLRAGKTFGTVPFDEFFQLGMERDNDLWLRGHVGTRDGRKGNAPLGTGYALLETGFDRTVARFAFLSVRAGPFFDAGRIGGPSDKFGSRGWLLDTGLQAKLIVAGGFSWSIVYGRDLRGGNGVFYTAVRY